jgi:hypothetical protein
MLELRKREAIDPEFREILTDYEEARSALDRWRAIDPPSSDRVADYEGLVQELEAEIENRLT